jgi:hypothetical protein
MKDFLKHLKGHFLPSEHNAYRPHLLRKQWLLFFFTILLTGEGLYIAALMTKESALNFISAVVPGEVIALTNAERQNVGDGALTENALLTLSAQNKANDMAAKGYFAHTSPDGKEPWGWISEAGYTYRIAGENLAVRFDNSAEVMSAWMASPTHRANILKGTYKEIGIGVAQGTYQGMPATFVVQHFASPYALAAADTSAPAPSATPALGVSSTVAGAETENVSLQPIATATEPSEPIVPVPVSQLETDNSQGFTREAAQTFVRASDASQSSINWIIGSIALFIVLLLGLAVFVHIHIQPAEMVMGGAFVAVVAISLLVLNTSIVGTSMYNSQSASVIEAQELPGVFVGNSAAAIELPE